MVRTWNKLGGPDWIEPLTEDEEQEREDYGLCGILPFARLPEGADRTNLTPMPFPDQVRRRKGLRKLQPSDLVCLNPAEDKPEPVPPAPIELSKRQIKAADRENGVILMLSWPWSAGVKPSWLPEDHAAWRQVALDLVSATCETNGLFVHKIMIEKSRRRPPKCSRRYKSEPYLAVHVMHERWQSSDYAQSYGRKLVTA